MTLIRSLMRTNIILGVSSIVHNYLENLSIMQRKIISYFKTDKNPLWEKTKLLKWSLIFRLCQMKINKLIAFTIRKFKALLLNPNSDLQLNSDLPHYSLNNRSPIWDLRMILHKCKMFSQCQHMHWVKFIHQSMPLLTKYHYHSLEKILNTTNKRNHNQTE